MLEFPEAFYNGVVNTYWDQINIAGQRLVGAYTDMVVVPATGQLPAPANANRGLGGRQATVYMHEVVNLFLRKEGKTFVFLDWDRKICRARWIETKEPPDPSSLLRQYFNGLHSCAAYRGRWGDGLGGGVPPCLRSENGSQRLDTPTFDEFMVTFPMNLSTVPYHRPGEKELGPTISPTEVIHLDFMHDIVTNEKKPIPEVLSARDKVSGTKMEPDPEWYCVHSMDLARDRMDDDVVEWLLLFKDWLMGRVGHKEKPIAADPEGVVGRFCRSLLGCFYRLPGDDSFMYLYGPGGTGKSVLQNSFSAMIGEYSTEVTRQALTKGNTTGHSSNTIQIYSGARVAIVKEARGDKGDIDTELVKDVTSFEPGRKYSVRAAYDAQPRLYATAAKPFFVSNDPPHHLLEADGIDRRLVAFSFLSRYVEAGEADRGLPEMLVSPRMRTALLHALLSYRESFLDKGSIPDPGENETEGGMSTYDVYMDLFKFRSFLTDSAMYSDSVNSRDLLEIRAYRMGFTSVEEMLAELGLSKNRATREAVLAVRDLVEAPNGDSVVRLGQARGGKRILLNTAVTDMGAGVLNEARTTLNSE